MLLTPDDCLQLQRASDVMLRPFDHSSAITYLKRVAQELRPLLGAFASVSAVRDPSGCVKIASDEWPESTLAGYARWKREDAGARCVVSVGVEATNIRRLVGGDWDLYADDPITRQWYRANGVYDVIAFVLHWPEFDTMASIEFHAVRFGLPRFGCEGEELLHLLLPSLRAGSQLFFSRAQHREDRARELDALGVPVCVCGRDGKAEYLSPLLSAMLARDPQQSMVLQEIAVVARAVTRAERGPTDHASSYAPPRTSRVVQTTRGRYRVRAALATYPVQLGATDILVTVTAMAHAPSDRDDIAKKFRMSPRESEVAVLLGEGARNDAIAAALSISPHTVRRHTERVLAKLGVTNRSQVAVVLRA